MSRDSAPEAFIRGMVGGTTACLQGSKFSLSAMANVIQEFPQFFECHMANLQNVAACPYTIVSTVRARTQKAGSGVDLQFKSSKSRFGVCNKCIHVECVQVLYQKTK